MDQTVIRVENLKKTYGSVTAVADVSLRVEPGTVFGLVGPNGAGKSTTIECIEGLREPTSGRIELLGQSPRSQRRAVFSQVGVLLQENELLPRRLRVHEIIELFRSFYPNPLDKAEVLANCGLEGQERVRASRLSGGQRRRLALALALIGRPRLVILDEPTSGLDPQARYNVWRLLLAYREAGGTIFVSTHYMDEAEEYCDELCLLDYGEVQIQGSPKRLMRERSMRVLVKVPARPELTGERLQALETVRQIEHVDDAWHVYSDTDRVYGELKALTGEDILEMRPARLEDLYLMTTGRSYRPGT